MTEIPDPADESAELRAAKAGDRAAFERILARYERQVLRVALALLRNPADAEDAAQEVFFRLHRHLRRFDEARQFAPWLYRLTVNVCHDLGRKRPPSASNELEALAALGPAPDEVASALERRAILAAREPIPDAGTIPADLQPTVNQLKSVLAFQGFRLLDTGLVRTREHDRFLTSGSLAAVKVDYRLRGRAAIAGNAQPPSLRIDDLELTGGGMGTVLTASVDVKPGQKAVIGKTTLGAEATLVLVVSGRVVD